MVRTNLKRSRPKPPPLILPAGLESITDTSGRQWIVVASGLADPTGRWPSREQSPDPDHVRRARKWLAERATPVRGRGPMVSAYAAKHSAERWCGRPVSRGAMILAAHRMGLRVRSVRGWGGTAGARIGICRRSYRQLPEMAASMEGHV